MLLYCHGEASKWFNSYWECSPPGALVAVVQGPLEGRGGILNEDIDRSGLHQLNLAAGNGQVADLDAMRIDNSKEGHCGQEGAVPASPQAQ